MSGGDKEAGAIRGRAIAAARAQGSMMLAGRIASIVLGIWLARLLTPVDYGYLAIALLLTGLIEVFSNFGIQSYLIQARELDDERIGLCALINLGLAATLGLAVALGAALWPQPLDPTLRMIIGLYGLVVLVSSMSYVRLALLKRRLRFQESAVIEFAGGSFAALARLLLALAGLGALCFPLGDLGGALLRVILARRVERSRITAGPGRREARAEVIWFGRHSVALTAAGFLTNQMDKILVVANFPAALVGLYSFGQKQAALIFKALVAPQVPVILSTLSRLKTDLAHARQAILDMSRFLVSCLLPIHLLLLVEAPAVVELVFTQTWLGSTVYLQLFLLDFAFRLFASGVSTAQMALGHADRAARTKWQNAGMLAAAFLAAALLDCELLGYAQAAVIGGVAGSLNSIRANCLVLQLSPWRLFGNLVIPVLLCAVSTALLFWLRPLFVGHGLFVDLLMSAALFAGSYTLGSFLFNRSLFVQLRATVFRR